MAALVGINWPINSVGVLPDVDPTRPGFLESGDGGGLEAKLALVNAKVPHVPFVTLDVPYGLFRLCLNILDENIVGKCFFGTSVVLPDSSSNLSLEKRDHTILSFFQIVSS